MAQMDAFSAQIVRFVREMPDEALLDLVKQKLGILGVVTAGDLAGRRAEARVLSAPVALSTPKNHAKRIAATAKRPVGDGGSLSNPTHPAARPRGEGSATKPPVASAERQDMLDGVERIVKAGSGVSASDVARLASIPQTRAAAALKELKLAKRIFQGGDRRFARYAGDLKMAEQASTTARKCAKGPMLPSRPAGRSRKRPQPIAPAPAT